MPLSRLELRFARLVPRHATRIVLCDDGDGLVERAADDPGARRLHRHLLFSTAASPAWEKAGFELFSGVNVPSKAFGEHIEHASDTPSDLGRGTRRADARAAPTWWWSTAGRSTNIQRVSIPTATNVPGAELVLRIHDIAPSPDTLVVVNCAGRTRSIIGAQSLINAGVPNKVVALRNGTMGCNLAGFCHRQRQEQARADHVGRRPRPRQGRGRARRQAIRRSSASTSPGARELSRARARRARSICSTCAIRTEYAAGHLPGAISAPGGQLVQATDQYAGTLGARIVLIDEHEVRAVMTASWLKQMGWRDVFVLAGAGNEKGSPAGAGARPRRRRSEHAIEAAALAELVAKDGRPPWSIFRSARPTARAISPAPGSPSARGCAGAGENSDRTANWC